ncbi:unnamed protein product [Lasius platythorax]|uniref:Uncharacterized protein n=1 Tax=Lasius platythorax TaxID=488582 RepID=A0AAV2NV23_9HYME
MPGTVERRVGERTRNERRKRRALERERPPEGGGDGGGLPAGGCRRQERAVAEKGEGRVRTERRKHGEAEVGGKLNLAQDVTAPGNTGVSVQ